VLQDLHRHAERDQSRRAALDGYDVLLMLCPEQNENRAHYEQRRDEIADLLEEGSGNQEPESARRTTSLNRTKTQS
jgi:hypothetical protein